MVMRGSGSENSLCCCEYVNAQGELSHLLACCCDCQALDQVCDRCLTCQKIPETTCDKMWATIQDRLRIPGFSGKGAVQVRLDVVFPILLIPTTLLLATISEKMTVFMLATMVILMFSHYRSWSRRNKGKRTRMFHVFSMTSVVILYNTFELVVIGFREILLWENLLLSTMFGCLMYLLHQMRKSPGLLRSTKQSKQISHERSIETRINLTGENAEQVSPSESQETISEKNVYWLDSRPFKDGQLDTWCSICHVKKTPRSGHCPVCNVCVRSRDHHCVWIDSCIGEENHQTFLLGAILFIICGCYGAHLTLTTVCTPEMYFDWFLVPNDCRFVYTDFYTAWAFVCACYVLLSCGMTACIVAHQCILISQNVTTQEMHMAARRQFLRFLFLAKNNVNNRGVYQNWYDFLTGKRKQSYANVTT